MKNYFVRAMLVGVAFGTVAITNAAVTAQSGPAAIDFTGGSSFAAWSADAAGDAVGWTFTVNSSINVTHLGVHILPDATLNSPHQVGIWETDTATLLTSTTVDGSSTAMDGFAYESIASFTLNPGTQYTIGAHYTIDDDDQYISGPSSVDWANEIDFIGATNPSVNGLGFVMPDAVNTGNNGRFGPNFLFSVPSPAALALFGLAGVVSSRRRRDM